MSATMCLVLALAGGHGAGFTGSPPAVWTAGFPAGSHVVEYAPATGWTTFYSPPVVGPTIGPTATVTRFAPTVTGYTAYSVPMAEPTIVYRAPAVVTERIITSRPAVVYEDPCPVPVTGPSAGYGPRGRTQETFEAQRIPRDDWFRGPDWYVRSHRADRVARDRFEARRGPAWDRGSPPAAVVTMTSSRFEPQRLTVRVGDTVEWRNTSDRMHTVTADPDRARRPSNVLVPRGAGVFHSGSLNPGERFTYTFNVPGTYRYVCLPHEDLGMTGEVVVLD